MLMLLDQFVFLAILFLFPKRDLLLIFLSKTLETGNRKQIKIIPINKCENKSKSGKVLVFLSLSELAKRANEGRDENEQRPMFLVGMLFGRGVNN